MSQLNVFNIPLVCLRKLAKVYESIVQVRFSTLLEPQPPLKPSPFSGSGVGPGSPGVWKGTGDLVSPHTNLGRTCRYLCRSWDGPSSGGKEEISVEVCYTKGLWSLPALSPRPFRYPPTVRRTSNLTPRPDVSGPKTGNLGLLPSPDSFDFWVTPTPI